MMNNYNFSNCMESTIAACLAVLAYRKDVEQKILELFPNMKVHSWSHHHGSHVHGLVFDDENNRVFSFERGTGGDNLWGNLLSFGTDARLLTGPDGFHNGFEHYGNRSFDLEKKYLENYSKIIMGAHSQGSGTQQYKACLCCENLNMEYKHVNCTLLAVPPACDDVGVKRIRKHIDSGMLSVNLYNNPGDPIGSDKLRNEKSIFLDGVYPVDCVVLPDPIVQNLGVAEVLAHSGRAYIATLMVHLGLMHYSHFIDYILLAKTHKLAVN